MSLTEDVLIDSQEFFLIRYCVSKTCRYVSLYWLCIYQTICLGVPKSSCYRRATAICHWANRTWNDESWRTP